MKPRLSGLKKSWWFNHVYVLSARYKTYTFFNGDWFYFVNPSRELLSCQTGGNVDCLKKGFAGFPEQHRNRVKKRSIAFFLSYNVVILPGERR